MWPLSFGASRRVPRLENGMFHQTRIPEADTDNVLKLIVICAETNWSELLQETRLCSPLCYCSVMSCRYRQVFTETVVDLSNKGRCLCSALFLMSFTQTKGKCLLFACSVIDLWVLTLDSLTCNCVLTIDRPNSNFSRNTTTERIQNCDNSFEEASSTCSHAAVTDCFSLFQFCKFCFLFLLLFLAQASFLQYVCKFTQGVFRQPAGGFPSLALGQRS